VDRSTADTKNTQQLQATDDDLDESEKEAMRTSLHDLAERTVAELIALDPELEDKLAKAYGYAVFDNYMINLVFYVAGKGNGIAIETASKEPTYMLMLRAGTGPGLGYTKMRQLLIVDTEETFEYMTTVGLDVKVSAHAAFKIGNFGGSQIYAESFNPNIDVYTIVDSGIDLQANWGAVEYLKDWRLNKSDKEDN